MSQDLEENSGNLLPSTQTFLSSQAGSSQTKKARHVGIVGVGFAGLRCADILLAQGLEVTILEARDRIGGRVHQTDLLGHPVDMGPNWIHGTSTNLIIALAKETGAVLCGMEDTPFIFGRSGQEVDPEKVAWALDTDFFADQVQNMGLCDTDSTLVMDMAAMWGGFIGDSWERQSMKYMWLEECLGGDNLFVNTHGKILDRVANTALQKATMHFNTAVTTITNSPDKDHRVFVQTKDAHTFEFDEIVVTVPLGALNNHSIEFNPPLAPQITRAISEATYSSLEKVQAWNPSRTSSPEYTMQSSPDSWDIEVLSLASSEVFGADNTQPTLLFQLYGSCAAKLMPLIAPHDPTSAEYFQIINDFFQLYYSRLPNYRATDSDCHPESVPTTNWQNDKLAGNGSYMNFTIGVEEKQKKQKSEYKLEEGIQALRHGQPERHIWLAGEHTAPFVALGTLTGAYWSGEFVAVRLLRTCKFCTYSLVVAVHFMGCMEKVRAATVPGMQGLFTCIPGGLIFKVLTVIFQALEHGEILLVYLLHG
ncbi:flavin monoamine oxidase family protein [Aspergillus affinis]|uniref:flavin monoamine oxidase family protein n=1 Tax=Aspergillus affinis TaxID=1070780 RepID=UPI0022FE137D|nr:flavin containing amine oxidase [Aspergillus affinis]KAI9042990.1 flavin containing amine oxidase [Aspergillus affinis]